jgi:hypothetical protein
VQKHCQKCQFREQRSAAVSSLGLLPQLPIQNKTSQLLLLHCTVLRQYCDHTLRLKSKNNNNTKNFKMADPDVVKAMADLDTHEDSQERGQTYTDFMAAIKKQKGEKKIDASGLLAREKFKELNRLKLCSRCAKTWHATDTEWPHLGSTCNSCQKKGHITPACSKVPWTNKQTSQANKVNQATSEDDDPNDNHCGLVFTGSDFGGL